jgi:uncharacterized repeat protein (TIGR03803 family)
VDKFNWRMRASGVFLLWATAAVVLPGQTFTTIYSFCSQPNCTDGAGPYAGLVQGTSGNLYGTTWVGGTSSACGGGCGTIFKITPSGKLTTLGSFDDTNGVLPFAGMIQAANGKFYGTTAGGGAHSNGTVFKATSSGTLTTLYSFCSRSQGSEGNIRRVAHLAGFTRFQKLPIENPFNQYFEIQP